ncbi:hypothetical protein Q7C36_022769 [Tachysurus vachellii]|uniref:Uncharacterized protein n=1 Tax=Tachysurus vachellii TaxID=175792 RepID=A0AA88IVG5_TACVA|nr:hypothetical protein Q7C36_022769 [Tachysurus vachellii]
MRREQEAHTNKEEARVFDLKGNALCSERHSSILHVISYKKKKIGIRLRSEYEHQREITLPCVRCPIFQCNLDARARFFQDS